MFLCKVCKSGEIKFGTDFCEACRSFHKRHRNRTDFQCRSGTNDCLKDLPLHSSNNQSYRYLCQKCRIETCRKIKMVHLHGKGKFSTIFEQVFLDNNAEMEKTFAQIQLATAPLTEQFAKITTRQLHEWPYNSVEEAYTVMSMCCQGKIIKLKELSRHFSFFNNLDVSDRFNFTFQSILW